MELIVARFWLCSVVWLAFLSGVWIFADGDKAPARKANHLASESSPYLQLHAHNPVDWYPWGAEALERARTTHLVAFDKTGTLTEGRPALVAVYPPAHRAEIVEIAAALQASSEHPLARAVRAVLDDSRPDKGA